VGRYILILTAALSLGGCTSVVTGTPEAAPGRMTVAPTASTDPCSLLTNDEAAALSLKGPGTAKPAEPKYRTPPSCSWHSSNPDASYDGTLETLYATDMPIGEYYSTQPAGQENLGGVTWEKYPSAIGDFMCDLAIKLSANSFVAISSQNLSDTSKACNLAEQAAPVVAKHLPRS